MKIDKLLVNFCQELEHCSVILQKIMLALKRNTTHERNTMCNSKCSFCLKY